jgi:hypothetical protein
VLGDRARRAEYDASGREDFTTQHPDAEATAILVGAFQDQIGQFVAGALGAHVDLMERVRRKLAGTAREQRAEIVKMRQMESAASDALARLARGDGAPDPLRGLLQQKLSEIGAAIVQMEVLSTQFDRAAELAKGWTWRVDAAPSADAQAGFTILGLRELRTQLNATHGGEIWK